MSTETDKVLAEIAAERKRQDTKWGEQNHPFHHPRIQGMCVEESQLAKDTMTASFYGIPTQDEVKKLCDSHIPTGETNFVTILLEEVVEAISEYDEMAIRAELLQVAAVAVNAIEAIDRRRGAPNE